MNPLLAQTGMRGDGPITWLDCEHIPIFPRGSFSRAIPDPSLSLPFLEPLQKLDLAILKMQRVRSAGVLGGRYFGNRLDNSLDFPLGIEIAGADPDRARRKG